MSKDDLEDKMGEIEDELTEELEGSDELMEFPLDRVSIYEKFDLEYLFRSDKFGIRFRVKGELIMTDLFCDLTYRIWIS